jgi:hypothetical protein
MKRYLLFISILLAVSTTMKAEWISLSKTKQQEASPKVTLLTSDKTSAILKIELTGFVKRNVYSRGKTLHTLSFLEEAFSNEIGSPELPQIAKLLAIPDNASVSYEIIETGEMVTFNNIDLAPVRESWLEGAAETEYLSNESVYAKDEFYPKEVVNIDNPVIFRDFRVARVAVYPVRYNPAQRQLQAISSITVKITFGNNETTNIKTSPKRPITQSFADLYRSLIFNYQEVLNAEYEGKEEGQDVILCITPDVYVPSLEPLAAWRRQRGDTFTITKFSDIGATANNPLTIKNYVSELYHNSENPPTYVLLIGDNGIFPIRMVTYSGYSFPDEDFFVKVDGNDFFPEMFIGRIPVQSTSVLDVVVNKILLYEKNPYMEDVTWFKKALVCSNNAYESQVETKRFTASVLRNEGGFTHVDTLMSNGNGASCTVNLSQVLAAINQGRSFLNYRGEGWSSGWHANCYYFQTDDVSTLSNGQKFTFVTSIGCGVAMFNTSGGNCFGEQWLKMGSISNPRGAIAFIGPTSNTHTAYNNKLDKGIYIGMFREGMNTPGQALLRGKLQVFIDHGTDPKVEYHYVVYCNLGDPATKIWKNVPQLISVNHPESISIGMDTNEITVTYAGSGFPVRNANICITGVDILINAKTDNQGKATLETSVSSIQTLNITVSGIGIKPYIGSMNAINGIEPINGAISLNLGQNTPNPFAAKTSIDYTLVNTTQVEVLVYNLNGQLVKTLSNQVQGAGHYTLDWDGKDQGGNLVLPGVYICTLKAGAETRTIRMIKL